jgi:dTDP-4-dehydrorhamnose 3,5-epimerase
MRLEELSIAGAYAIHGTQSMDDRGAFTRVAELPSLPNQATVATNGYLAVAHNTIAGTVRGLHFQTEPARETKLVWCSAGSVYDVLVDVRRGEPTYGQWVAVELSFGKPLSLVVPPGVAHGYQTLVDDTALSYLIDGRREPDCERSINWRDEDLAISWPRAVSEISDRDAKAPRWEELQ